MLIGLWLSELIGEHMQTNLVKASNCQLMRLLLLRIARHHVMSEKDATKQNSYGQYKTTYYQNAQFIQQSFQNCTSQITVASTAHEYANSKVS